MDFRLKCEGCGHEFLAPRLKIERNIRNFIEVTWTRGDMKAQHKIFGNTVEDAKTRPTNKEFIANLTQYTIRRLNKTLS